VDWSRYAPARLRKLSFNVNVILKYFLVVQELSLAGAATLEGVDFQLRKLEHELKKLEARSANEGAAAAAAPLELTGVQDGLGNSILRFRGVGSPARGPSRRPPARKQPPVPAPGDKRPSERAPGESPAARRQAAAPAAAPAATAAAAPAATAAAPAASAAAPPLELQAGTCKKRLGFQATLDEVASACQEEEDRAAAAKAVAAEISIAGRRQPRAAKDGAGVVLKSYVAAARGEASPQPPAAAPPPPTAAPTATGGGRPPVAHPPAAGGVHVPVFPSGLPNPAAGAQAAGLPFLVYMQHMAAFFSFQQHALSGPQAPQ